MKKLYALFILSATAFIALGQYSPQYQRSVSVIENFGDTTSHYVAMLEVNTSTPIGQGKMNMSGDDIRFGDGCSSNYYPYWIESGINTSNTRIFVKVPFLDADDTLNFSMFYGDSAATAMSDFNSTFPNRLVTTGNSTVSGVKNYGWLEVASGDTLFLGNNTILDIRAAYVKIEGAIVGSGSGFTGGTVGPNSGNGPGGGGGSSNAGCGGGGYGGAGGLGGFDSGDTPGAGGSSNGSINGFSINKGSGGGSGSSCQGGSGGGAVAIKSRLINITGDLIMDGADGQMPGCPQGGGGGAGGGILIAGDSVTVTGSIFARGGDGSVGTSTANDDGGGGGGGRIKVFHDANYSSGGSRTTSAGQGGPNGSTAASNGNAGTSFDSTRTFTDPMLGIEQAYQGTPPPTQVALEICEGDSVMLGGAYRSTNGTYTDTLSNANGCDSLVRTALSVTSTDTSINQSGATLSAITSGQNYQWLKCDSTGYTIIPGATNQTYQATENGFYALAVNVNNCSDTSDCVEVMYVGIESWEARSNVYLYPNPAKDELNIVFTQSVSKLDIDIMDMNGRAHYSNSISNGKQISIDISTLSKGIYFVRTVSENKTDILKFIKK